MKRLLVVVGAVVAVYGLKVVARPSAPQPIEVKPIVAETSVARGRLVYQKYGCAACHGDDAKGGFANPNSETEGKVPGITFVAEGFTKPELRKKILEGLATVGKKDANGPKPPFRMPGWAGVMSSAELTDLVEYLWSLLPKASGDSWR